jgi:D-3-phosphoglycerate dehydrogenase
MRRTRQLSHLTVGIVGAGRIGREVATRLSGFGGTVIGHDPWVPADAMVAAGIAPVTMRQLTERSDIITLHIPGDQTVVDASWLAQVKNGVDEGALAASLADGTVAAYAADTLSLETGKGSAHVLLDEALSDHTIFTPHWAAQTVEAVDNMGRGAVDAVLAVLSGQSPPNLVATPSSEVGNHDG